MSSAERIKALKSAHSIEPSPERTSSRAVAAAEVPVTARIRRRIDLPAAQEAAIETDRAGALSCGRPELVPSARLTPRQG